MLSDVGGGGVVTCSPKAGKKGGNRNDNECSLLRGVWEDEQEALCRKKQSSAQNSHTSEASQMTEVNMTEGSQRHTCRNGKG